MDSQVSLEWLILADSAEIANNKLYMLGGGWDLLTVNSSFPVSRHVAIAAAFNVPWSATNQKHNVEISIVAEDASEALGGIAGEFEVGRPAGIPPGSAQRTQLAAEAVVEFKLPGAYSIRCKIDGQEQRPVPFRVVEGPLLALKKRSST